MPIKQLDRQQSAAQIRKFLKSLVKLDNSSFTPGNLLIYRYNAKDKTKVWDKRPMVLVLAATKTRMLGLNFHWIPFAMRVWLVRYILKQNKKRIRNGEKIVFGYKKIKPLLKKLGYAPCIRLYIRTQRRISPNGVVLPPERLIEAAQLRMEMFTGVPEKQLWKTKSKATQKTKK